VVCSYPVKCLPGARRATRCSRQGGQFIAPGKHRQALGSNAVLKAKAHKKSPPFKGGLKKIK